MVFADAVLAFLWKYEMLISPILILLLFIKRSAMLLKIYAKCNDVLINNIYTTYHLLGAFFEK